MAGQDVHSVVADPLFTDAAHGDYRLRPESPALTRGFKELPYAEMGIDPNGIPQDAPAILME